MDESKIRIGKTDIVVPPLGIGIWQWGDRSTWNYGQGYGEQDLRAVFDTALAAGVDFFDTAEVYGGGLSEKFLGQFLRESGQHVTIATKFAPLPWRWRRSSVVEALRRSLNRLGVERVDLYQIHWPWTPISIETWVEGLADAVQAGLTRAAGVSNFSAAQTRRAANVLRARGLPLASNQIEYSLLQRGPERSGVIQACRELGVSVIAYSPIRKGLLTGKYTPENPPPGRRGMSARRDYLARIQPLIESLWRIGAAHGDKTPVQVSLNWLICKGAIPIPGAKNARQAQENAGALGWRLTDAEVAELDTMSEKV